MSEPLFKVGDFVVEEFRGVYGTGRDFLKVARVTKTQAITSDGKRWRIASGRRVGGPYSSRIVPLTQELRERCDLQRLRQRIADWCYRHRSATDFARFSVDGLTLLWEVMEGCERGQGNA